MGAQRHVGPLNKCVVSDPQASPLLMSVSQGTPQYIQLSFASPVIPKRVEITFQGGFVGTRCSVEVLPSGVQDGGAKWRVLTRIYPEDVNRKQTFDLLPAEPDLVDCRIEGLKFVFEESSDFFGRVTVYDLRVLGVIPS